MKKFFVVSEDDHYVVYSHGFFDEPITSENKVFRGWFTIEQYAHGFCAGLNHAWQNLH